VKKVTPTAGVTADGWVSIGVVARAHGLKGALKLHPWNDGGGHVLEPGLEIRVGGKKRRVARYASAILELEGLDDRNESETLKGQEVLVRRADFPEEEGAVYLVDLVGAPVLDGAGASLGTVVGIGDNGAQPLLVVKTGRGEVLVPFVAAFVTEATNERVVLTPPRGLFDDDAVVDESESR
jgi:16S rRNA processing protein RimM